MDHIQAKVRLKELRDEVLEKLNNGGMTPRRMDAVERESAELEQVIKNRKIGLEYRMGNELGDLPPLVGASTKAFGARRWNPATPLHASQEQIKSLWLASKNRLPSYGFDIGGDGGNYEMGFKAANPISDGNIDGGGLPPIIEPGRFLNLPYEPDDLWSHFQGAAMDGPAVSYLEHTGNFATPALTPELGLKPDIGPQVTAHTVTPVKLAAICKISTEALEDYQSFAQMVPVELHRAMTDTLTDWVVNDSVSGILHAANTLSRPVGGDTLLDALQQSFNDLRVGPAFATADLVAMNPRRGRCANGRKTASKDIC